MKITKENKTLATGNNPKTPVWRVIVQNVFGAAVRLHQYRERRDAMLRRVFLDYEQQLRDDRCCDE
jgi:hypothetical protein